MSNRLSEESSLYLRQHRDNPVDWWPWGEEALARARAERKPILLSIGYSACHWCHVMAHESFEDAATAQVMNALFVNIKLDREERPDLDKIYQLAHQALARRGGGWPLTVFLTPDDLLPFYAGTYFPPQARHGLPAFVDVLRGVRRWFDERPQEIEQQNAALGEFLADYGKEAVALDRLDATPLALVRERIAANFDADNGGHRGAPKFPAATELALLQALAREGDTEAGSMATLGLRRMAERGLHDHLGGGYFRYCVDAEWSIPHFEKMLNDNAALLAIYAEAAAHSGEAEFLAAAEGIVAWLQRDMALDGGGYASALDADAEGEEGRYYVWTREQIAAGLTASAPADFDAAYGLDARAQLRRSGLAPAASRRIRSAPGLCRRTRSLAPASCTARPAGTRRQAPHQRQCTARKRVGTRGRVPATRRLESPERGPARHAARLRLARGSPLRPRPGTWPRRRRVSRRSRLSAGCPARAVAMRMAR
jgi:uncharacterized protein YyaL (SSP411 family)